MPPIMPPMPLAARRLRVDDAAGAVGAHDAPHAGFAEVRIDRDFDKYAAEGMHRKALVFIPV
jgi:hypothetical protein